MKHTFKIFAVFAAAMLFACQPHTDKKAYTVDGVPNVRLADRFASVSNPDSTLSSAVVAEINRKLFDLQEQTSIQVAVVVISSIGDAPVEDFANRLFRKWEIGQRNVNNGLLILGVTGDRLVRFEVGYGLEGVLTDAMSKRIQTTRMMPYLRENDWNGAMTAGVDAVVELFTDPASDLRTEAAADAAGKDLLLGIILFIAGLVIFWVITIFTHRKANKCPRCGAQMKVIRKDSLRTASGKYVTVNTLKCPKCGYTTTKNNLDNSGGMSNIDGRVIGGIISSIIGALAGGGRGGGGSWGGGSSGGGGATTRF